MYHIAIVEDELEVCEQLIEYLKNYEKENNMSFRVSVFSDGAEIVENYINEYDLILLDIQMPILDGMTTAEKIRERDEDVVLMFITNMTQYAIKGYSVGALDFTVKPITYYTFAMKLTRALKRVVKKETNTIVLKLADGIKTLEIKQIYYVEIQNRMLHYYTVEGEIVVRGTLQSAEEVLGSYPFVKCNHWYIVNLMHVIEVVKCIATVGPYQVEISRRNKTAFLKALMEYVGGNA